MSRKAMPTNEMGHPPSSADAPPPLTSGEIELDLVERARKTWWEIVDSDGGECGLMAIVRELADEVERLRSPPSTAGWLPISTAPRDRDALYFSDTGKIDLGRMWRGKCTCEWMDGFGTATLWHEVPAPPTPPANRGPV